MKCRHCKEKIVGANSRGLCEGCYHTTWIRRKYSAGAKITTPDFYGRAHLGAPTTAVPGTYEKMEVMMERARRGLAIFHPDDTGIPILKRPRAPVVVSPDLVQSVHGTDAGE